MECGIKGCNKKATKKIVFKILARTGNAPAIAEPSINACEKCATEEAANELLIDNIQGRRQIEDSFEANGLARPDWTRSKAEWVEI